METSPQKLNRKFSYKDYLAWTDEKDRWELINGTAYDMSPDWMIAAATEHRILLLKSSHRQLLPKI